MKLPVLLFCLALTKALWSADAEQTIRTTSELRLLPLLCSTNLDFNLQGTVVCLAPSYAETDLILKDDFGSVGISNPTTGPVAPGDTIRVSGIVTFDEKCKPWLKAKEVCVIRHGPRPSPVPTTVADVLSGRHDYQLVRVSGTVIDEFQDDIDLNHHCLLLASAKGSIIVSLSEKDFRRSQRLLNSEISVVGLCRPDMGDWRIFHGHGLSARSDDIAVITPAPVDPFDVPLLENLRYVDSSHVLRLTRRHISGTVIAVWHGNRFLLAADDKRTVGVTVARGIALPHTGQHVCVAGLPDTDLFNINLIGAIWKVLSDEPSVSEPETVSLRTLFYGYMPGQRFHPNCHGKVLNLQGVVRSIPRSDFNNTHLFIEQDGHTLPVDVSSCPAAIASVEIGCTVALSGICILETENERLNAPFPRVKGFTIVLRHPTDLHILSCPSWWTPGRLLAVIGILLAVILVILVWNILLRRISERRGKELAVSAIAKAESDLKTYERTRLAIELHDSVAQNLTGASLALRGKNYELAARTLDSCREDLRNCLWDLRNLTLDDVDINAAIRKTLAPHVGTAALTVRFSVPRERFTDNTTHAILRILRELATNAVRHGGATAIRIAGSIEGDRLLFSVRDDGCGFDPAAAPGMEQGHFGLQGIRDRVDSLEGDVTIDSSHGKGTKVTVSLHVPQERNETQA